MAARTHTHTYQVKFDEHHTAVPGRGILRRPHRPALWHRDGTHKYPNGVVPGAANRHPFLQTVSVSQTDFAPPGFGAGT